MVCQAKQNVTCTAHYFGVSMMLCLGFAVSIVMIKIFNHNIPLHYVKLQ